MKSLVIMSLLSVFIGCSSAVGAPASLKLSDFQCYKLDREKLGISDEEYRSGVGLPPVFAEPRADARKVGTEPGIVFVRYPLKIENGFAQVLRRNGAIAWISDDAVRPMRKANGTEGGCTLAWSSDGKYVQSKLDPGVGLRY